MLKWPSKMLSIIKTWYIGEDYGAYLVNCLSWKVWAGYCSVVVVVVVVVVVGWVLDQRAVLLCNQSTHTQAGSINETVNQSRSITSINGSIQESCWAWAAVNSTASFNPYILVPYPQVNDKHQHLQQAAPLKIYTTEGVGVGSSKTSRVHWNCPHYWIINF